MWNILMQNVLSSPDNPFRDQRSSSEETEKFLNWKYYLFFYGVTATRPILHFISIFSCAELQESNIPTIWILPVGNPGLKRDGGEFHLICRQQLFGLLICKRHKC